MSLRGRTCSLPEAILSTIRRLLRRPKNKSGGSQRHRGKLFIYRSLAPNLFERVADFLRVECANRAPDFVALRVKINKGGCEFKIVNGSKFHADSFLNIQTDKVNLFTNADFVINFLFKPVNGGFYLGAGNSEGGLKFEQDGRAGADQCLHRFGVIHQRCLARMQNDPGGNEAGDNDPEGEIVVYFWLVGKQHKAGGNYQYNRSYKKGVFSEEWYQKTLWWANVMFCL